MKKSIFSMFLSILLCLSMTAAAYAETAAFAETASAETAAFAEAAQIETESLDSVSEISDIEQKQIERIEDLQEESGNSESADPADSEYGNAELFAESNETVSYSLWIGNKQVDSSNKDDILDDGKASFDPSTNTLTLQNGFEAKGFHEIIRIDSPSFKSQIYAENMDLTVKAPSKGLILSSSRDSCGLFVENGSLSVNGDITGIVEGEMLCARDIYIDGNVDVSLSERQTVFYTYGELSADDGLSETDILSGTGKVEITGNAAFMGCGLRAIQAAGDIDIGGDLLIGGGTADYGEELYVTGIYSKNGKVTIGRDFKCRIYNQAVQALKTLKIGGKTDIYVSYNIEGYDDIIRSGDSVIIDGDVLFTGNTYNAAISAEKDILLKGSLQIGDADSPLGFEKGLSAFWGTVTMTSGSWNIVSFGTAVKAGEGIIIPDTHEITAPEGGSIGKAGDRWTVLESDGSTAAAAVRIVPKPVYTVTFEMNGHGTAPKAQTVTEGKTAEKPEDPAAEGWEFKGWYKDAGFGTAFDFNAVVTEDTVIYAKWIEKIPEPKTFTVTFSMNGHGTAPKAQTVTEGKTAEKPEDPAAEGWEFKGWYKDAGFGTAFDFNAAVTEDTVIYAKWIEKIPEPKTFTVTFRMNGHGTAPKAQTVTEGKTAEKPENPAAEGWEFKDWYKDAGFGTAFDFNAAVTEDTVIYAKWTEIWKPIADTDDSANITAVLFTGTWNNPVSSGIWKQDINDRWFYSTEAVFRNTWAYIVNPYARDGQNRADWFWFDKNGKMLTGWQYINGKWYYLNPNSDGTLGACFTGPGKTPDGYEVDSSGAWIG